METGQLVRRKGLGYLLPLKTETRLKGMETKNHMARRPPVLTTFENRDPLKGDGNRSRIAPFALLSDLLL